MSENRIDEIKKMSDRELMEHLAYNSARSERHLRRISNNVIFFFWVCFIALLLLAGLALFTVREVPSSYY